MNSARPLPELEGYIADIERLAYHFVKRLVRSGRLPTAERSDFVQDLLVHVVKQWPQLAENDFDPLGFAQLVMRQKSSNELRKRNSRKALFNRGGHQDGDSGTEQLTNSNAASHGSDQQRVAALLDRLDPSDRQLAELVMSHSPSEAAEQLGITTRQLASRRRHIAEQLQSLI